ncbi:IS630 family transposase [Candidatus Poribacteria bacterium]|nr:IS630 family transposase [Candidatus Poribacteria bacterium]
MKKIALVEYQKGDKEKLSGLIRGRNTAQKIVLRARIVLMLLEGENKLSIARRIGIARATVYLWSGRYREGGVAGLLKDAPRPGRIPTLSEEKEKAIVEATLHTKPENATHWSVRLMAKTQGVSRMAVQRIWKKYNLKPHLVHTFKLSNDPDFVEKVKDVVGLYLQPPEKALVFSVDEKSQIQALDRLQPSLPLTQGHRQTMPHDYKRHGTTTLFAALNILDGKIIGECMPKHRQSEFLKFLKRIDKETPKGLELHLIMDNYSSHKGSTVKQWLGKHPRVHFHFTPTSSSWLNLVERFFSEITTKMIRRGVFRSVQALTESIMSYLAQHNQSPKKFIWTKDAGTIIEKVNNCTEALGTAH